MRASRRRPVRWVIAVHTRLVARHGSASSRSGMIFSTSLVARAWRWVSLTSGSVAARRKVGRVSRRAILIFRDRLAPKGFRCPFGLADE